MDSDSDVGYNSFVELRGTPDFDAGYLVSVVVVALFVVDSFNFRLGTRTQRRMPCRTSPANLWPARL